MKISKNHYRKNNRKRINPISLSQSSKEFVSNDLYNKLSTSVNKLKGKHCKKQKIMNLGNLTKAIKLLQIELSEKSEIIDGLSQKVKSKEKDIDYLKKRVFDLQQEVFSYISSKSWRSTRPLRKFIKLFKWDKNV